MENLFCLHKKNSCLFTFSGAALEDPNDCTPYANEAPHKSKVAEQFNEAFTKLWEDKYHVSVAYTDMIRRVSEKYGPLSIEMKSALHNIDDILQRCLTDIRSKEMTKGVQVCL